MALVGLVVVVVIVAAGVYYAAGPITPPTPTSSQSSQQTSHISSSFISSTYATSTLPSSTSSMPRTLPQFSIRSFDAFGYKLNKTLGYGFAIASILGSNSDSNVNMNPRWFKLITDLGAVYTDRFTQVTSPNGDWAGEWWADFQFSSATQQPKLLSIEYDCASRLYEGYQITCDNSAAANATATLPNISWVTFERDGSLGPAIVNSSLGFGYADEGYSYFPDNATLKDVNIFVGTSFNGLAPHEDVPGGYQVNITIPWSYNCGNFASPPEPCGMSGTISSANSDFKIVSSRSTLDTSNSLHTDQTFYVVVEFPNIPYSSFQEGGGAIPLTITYP